MFFFLCYSITIFVGNTTIHNDFFLSSSFYHFYKAFPYARYAATGFFQVASHFWLTRYVSTLDILVWSEKNPDPAGLQSRQCKDK